MAGSKKSDPPASFEVGDIVLAKVKGYPAWPARVIDPESAPPAVRKDRPKGTKTQFYCVCFFPTGDHAWQVTAGLQKLQKHEIEAYVNEPSKKNGDLLNGYKVALDPSEWDANRAELVKQLEEEAKNAPIDELDEDAEEDSTGKAPAAKKRKRASEAATESKKKDAAATPAKKAAAKGAKAKAEAAATPKGGKKRGKKNGVTSAEMIAESEDDGEKKDGERPSKRAKGDDDEEDEQNLTPEAKMVKGWRHELQRVFLSKSGLIKPEDMEKASANLKTVEDYGSNMTLTLLSTSKIGKVIKKMTALPADAIPNNDEFKIRDRSNALLTEWSKVAQPSSNGNGNASTEPPAATESKTEAKADEANGDVTMDIDAVAEPEVPAGPTADAEAEADVEMKEDAPASAPAATEEKKDVPPPAADATPAATDAAAPAPAADAPVEAPAAVAA